MFALFIEIIRNVNSPGLRERTSHVTVAMQRKGQLKGTNKTSNDCYSVPSPVPVVSAETIHENRETNVVTTVELSIPLN